MLFIRTNGGFDAQGLKKTSEVSTGSLRKRVRGLERSHREGRGHLDEMTGLLEDSLDESRLGTDPSDTATEIADYIESQQDGWDCDTPGGSVLTLSPPLLEILGPLFIPLAFAEENLLKIDGEEDKAKETNVSENEARCPAGGGTWDSEINECICKDTNKTWNGKKCVRLPQEPAAQHEIQKIHIPLRVEPIKPEPLPKARPRTTPRTPVITQEPKTQTRTCKAGTTTRSANPKNQEGTTRPKTKNQVQLKYNNQEH